MSKVSPEVGSVVIVAAEQLVQNLLDTTPELHIYVKMLVP